MGMRAIVIQYLINVRTQKKGGTNPEQEQIWNGFKIVPNKGRHKNFGSLTNVRKAASN